MFFKKAICFGILLFTATYAISQKDIIITDAFKYESLNQKLFIFTDSTKKLTITDILSKYNDKFILFSKNKKTSDSFHWCRFKLNNTSLTSKKITIQYDQIFADYLCLYLVDAIQNIEVIDSPQGWTIPNNLRPYPYIRYPIFSVTLPAKSQREVYFKFQKRDGGVLKMPFSVWEEKHFFYDYNNENLFRGFFYGWMFFVCFLSLSFFISLRENIYLYYGLYVLFLAGNLAATGGTLNHFFWYLPRTISGPEGYAFFSSLYIYYNIRFTTSYLESEKNSSRWLLVLGNFYTIIALILAFCLAFIKSLIYFHYHYLIQSSFTFIFIIIIILYVIYGLKNKSFAAIIYLFSISPILFSTVCFILSFLGMINFNDWIITIFKISVLLEIFILSLGLAYRYFLVRKEKRKLELIVIESQNQILKAQETERSRLAQDLHDDLGGTLSAIKGKVANETSNPVTLFLVEKAIEDLRLISRNLLPPELSKDGLVKAIKQTIERLQNASKIAFTFITFGKEQRMAEDRELNAYRVISELLNNIVKHSKATKATAQLVFYEDFLYISIEDNGSGIKTLQKDWGIGLKNVNSRIEFLKAKLLRDSGDNGTTFIIEILYDLPS